MKRTLIRLLLLQTVFAACNKEPIYRPDPNDAPSKTPLVSVIYDPGALGDMTYNDLLYEGVERAAFKAGIRTDQYSPRNKEEGLTWLSNIFDQMSDPADTTRRLLIIAGSSYEEYVRANNRRLEVNSRADILYFDTEQLLEGKGSSIHLRYYGAMYMAGVVTKKLFAHEALVIAANPYDVAEPLAGYQAGFDGTLYLEYISDQPGKGFSIGDEEALHIMYRQEWDGIKRPVIVPLCGGAGSVFRRLAENDGFFKFMGVDKVILSTQCDFAAVKHTDNAVELCIQQWLSDEGLPKHQTLGLAEGYTELVFCPAETSYLDVYAQYFPVEEREALRKEAIKKEEAYENH
jgi:basic membrane lipoprotein Med (substrate-binding protein (PBP1-ABC) superfamily)